MKFLSTGVESGPENVGEFDFGISRPGFYGVCGGGVELERVS